MTILITGSSGHLGEALTRAFSAEGKDYRSFDIKPGPYTQQIGSITDRVFVREAMRGVRIVLHAATLHKPHIATHSQQEFIDVNIMGALTLLEEAVAAGVSAFVFTSTTSVFGRALSPPETAPAAWIDETVASQPKNIYGVTKLAAEHLCEIAARRDGLPCVILRTSRFFPEEDDSKLVRDAYSCDNAKLNEFLYRRADLEDIVAAHLLAAKCAPSLGFARYIISATTPFQREDATQLRKDAPAILRRYIDFDQIYERLGWRMFPSIDRVYSNDLARTELGWRPKHDFASMLAKVANGESPMSDLARAVGVKGYHDKVFAEGPYPTA